MTFNHDDIDRFERFSRAELIAKIGENAYQLVKALEIARQPYAHTSQIQFDLDEKPVRMPEFMAATLDPASTLEHLTVGFDQSEETGQTSLELILSIRNHITNQPISLTLSQEQGQFVSRIIIDTSAPIDTLVQPTNEEIAVFIASVFMHSTTSDYDMLKSMDLWDQGVLERLEDALSRNAHGTITTGMYRLPSQGGQGHSIAYAKEDESVVSIQLSRGDTLSASVLDITLDGSSDFAGDYSMASLEGIRLYEKDTEQNGTKSVDCTTDRLIDFNHFIIELGADVHSSTVEIATHNLDTVDPDPSSNHTDSYGKPLRSHREFDI